MAHRGHLAAVSFLPSPLVEEDYEVDSKEAGQRGGGRDGEEEVEGDRLIDRTERHRKRETERERGRERERYRETANQTDRENACVRVPSSKAASLRCTILCHYITCPCYCPHQTILVLLFFHKNLI